MTKKSKHILFHGIGATDASFFDENARDNCTEPFIALKKKCKELGYSLEVTKQQKLEDCEWLIFWDVPSIGPTSLSERLIFGLRNRIQGRAFRNLYQEALRAGMSDRMVLILAEPPSVYSRNLERNLHKHFKIVFTWDSNLVDGTKYVRALLPVTSVFPNVESIPFSEKKLLVDISSNKYSRHERELYTMRRNTIKFFEQCYPADFDLYGTGWNQSQQNSFWGRLTDTQVSGHYYASYQGTVVHKSQIMP